MKKKYAMVSVLSALITAASMQCAGTTTPARFAPAAVVAVGKTVYCRPPLDSSMLERLDAWPADTDSAAVLRREMEPVYGALLAELRRGQRAGMYSVTDDSLMKADIILTPVFRRAALRNDSLLIPLGIEVATPGARGVQSFSLEACGVIRGTTTPSNSFHRWGILLADWRRSLPYAKAAGLFYPRKL